MANIFYVHLAKLCQLKDYEDILLLFFWKSKIFFFSIILWTSINLSGNLISANYYRGDMNVYMLKGMILKEK